MPPNKRALPLNPGTQALRLDRGLAAPGLDPWISVARVIDAWGLAGWVKLDLYGDRQSSVLRKAKRWLVSPPQRLATIRASSDQSSALPSACVEVAVEVAVVASRPHSSGWLAQFEGFDDRNQALALKGFEVAVRREDFPRLPKGEYYWVDLIGCRVLNRADELLGEVVAMDDHGAHPILHVKQNQDAAPDFFIPFVGQYVDQVDVNERCIQVDWSSEWL
ncbi:MAG: 16S rRNA processing protein RimM [Betaproteobacteria bacterium]|nr:16S rRNA processing protein RimM [Betaproteobacteria bacterium]NBO43133.1 16S rRNA processing protein RimM [Betaproteobacteria bacterium]NBP10308.1 16S rRNA processing protein RimM [Betaproteobacteria bacterium]NBP61485.1 16S rRNA processing protein RimM [Betaproteobacteria bacterium]NBQ09241.1 16S rRNA processing protein RimM [Betaproteobacteria bacterium]